MLPPLPFSLLDSPVAEGHRPPGEAGLAAVTGFEALLAAAVPQDVPAPLPADDAAAAAPRPDGNALPPGGDALPSATWLAVAPEGSVPAPQAGGTGQVAGPDGAAALPARGSTLPGAAYAPSAAPAAAVAADTLPAAEVPSPGQGGALPEALPARPVVAAAEAPSAAAPAAADVPDADGAFAAPAPEGARPRPAGGTLEGPVLGNADPDAGQAASPVPERSANAGTPAPRAAAGTAVAPGRTDANAAAATIAGTGEASLAPADDVHEHALSAESPDTAAPGGHARAVAPAGPLPAAAADRAGAPPLPATGMPPLPVPPGAEGWSDALGGRVLMLAGQHVQHAEIELNPAELGPVRVQLTVDDGSAAVSFHASHPLTRDAIEQSLPRLRELFEAQGITLGDASVSDQPPARDETAPGHRGDGYAVRRSVNWTVGGPDAAPEAPARAAARGLIDLFA